jgi:hypothetical protein
VVVNDLDFKRVAFPPYKADAILLVDSNAMLTLPIALERLEPKADAPKIVQRSCLIKKEKSPKGDALKSLEARHPLLVEKPFGVAVRKAAYQTAPMILRKPYYVKRIVKPSGRTEGAERHSWTALFDPVSYPQISAHRAQHASPADYGRKEKALITKAFRNLSRWLVPVVIWFF